MKNACTCVFLLIAVLSAHTQQLIDQKRQFAIEISIQPESLQKELFRRNGRFLVQARIVNISIENQTIVSWEPGGGCWISDNEVISTEVNALMTSEPAKRILKPKEALIEHMEVVFYPRSQRAIMFRLGFFPTAKSRESCKPDAIPRGQITWSNTVTLTQ